MIILIFFFDSSSIISLMINFTSINQTTSQEKFLEFLVIVYIQGNQDNELSTLGWNWFKRIIQIGKKIGYFTKFS